MERFPLNLITDPTAIMNDDRRDVYNNILLFTISGDTYQHTPSEMHIFQCKSTTVSLFMSQPPLDKPKAVGRLTMITKS